MLEKHLNILNLNDMIALDKLVTLQLCRHLLMCPMLGDIDEPLNLFPTTKHTLKWTYFYVWQFEKHGNSKNVTNLHLLYLSFWQLWTVALWLTQPMAKLVTLLEQHLDRRPPTVVILATSWWETTIVHVKLQACGLGVNPSVRVCCNSY